MKTRKMIAASLAGMAMAAGMATLAAAGGHEDLVTLAQTPPAVQLTIQQHATALDIKKIDMEIEDGQVVYSVEIVKDGKETELEVAADGTLMEADEEMALEAAPEAVRTALAAQAGKVIEISKWTEAGVVQYEATLEQNGKERELVLAADGQITAKNDAEDEDEDEDGDRDEDQEDDDEDRDGSRDGKWDERKGNDEEDED
jgi:uncharacterized membrane protein YkoI